MDKNIIKRKKKLRHLIKVTGSKQLVIANVIGINKDHLNRCLSLKNSLFLSAEKEALLEAYLLKRL